MSCPRGVTAAETPRAAALARSLDLGTGNSTDPTPPPTPSTNSGVLQVRGVRWNLLSVLAQALFPPVVGVTVQLTVDGTAGQYTVDRATARAALAAPLVCPVPFALPDGLVGDVFATNVLVKGYAGPIFRVRRSSDGALTDLYGDPASYTLPDGTAYAAWLGGDTAYVATWYNQGRAGNHATQGTLASQPVLRSSVGGVVAVDTRTGRFLTCTNGITRSAYSIIVRHLASDAATGCMVGSGPYTTRSAAALYHYNGGKYLFVWWNGDLGGGAFGSAGGTAAATYNGATRTLYVNGAAVASDALPPQAGAGQAVTIGTGGTAQHFNGDLQRVFLYDACLTASQINQISQ